MDSQLKLIVLEPDETPCPDVHHEGVRIEAVPGIADAVVGHDGEDRVQTFALG